MSRFLDGRGLQRGTDSFLAKQPTPSHPPPFHLLAEKTLTTSSGLFLELLEICPSSNIIQLPFFTGLVRRNVCNQLKSEGNTAKQINGAC